MGYPAEFDFKNPDYRKVFQWRIEILKQLREKPELVGIFKTHYKANPLDFIEDWGVTFDPRNIDRDLPAVIPIILFPRQREFLQWVLDMWRARLPGISDKSRDMGLSWMCAALSVTMALSYDGFVFGFGSRKEDLVDSSGDPDSLFYKIRMFLGNLPVEFRGGWVETSKRHSSHMHIEIPATGSVIRGEAGDNLGRGGRAGIYIVDEAAFLARPQLVEASLSQTTNCRIDLSSVNGTDNPFATKRHSFPAAQVFTFSWRDDPRKDKVWYDKQCLNLNPLIVAQEIDLDYSASKEGVLIPSAWVQAAIDAHFKLGFKPLGIRDAALDVADEGLDLNAFAARHGPVLTFVKAWSGQGSTIFKTTETAFDLAAEWSDDGFHYDSDGLGVGVRGDAEQINARAAWAGPNAMKVFAWRGSGEVMNKEDQVFPIKEGANKNKGRTNENFFKNRKAQAWWALRTRFEKTFMAVVHGMSYDPDELISIPSNLPERGQVVSELSQPTYKTNDAGLVIVNKTPDGQRSPNHADAVMMVFSPGQKKRRGFFG